MDAVRGLAQRIVRLERVTNGLKRGTGASVRWDKIIGRPAIGTGVGQLAPGNIQSILGLAHGTAGRRHRLIAAVIRNTGSGFELINDASHAPIGMQVAVTTTTTHVTLDLSFVAGKVNAAVAVPDEKFAIAGYVFGTSVGTSSITIQGSQPGGFGDYVYYNGSAWTSLNGRVTGLSFDAGSGYLTCTHAAMDPVGGSFTSRSLTNRGVLDQMSATTTRVAWVNSSGVTIKTPSTDLRGWITRTGSVLLDPTTLTLPNSNIWVLGVMEL